jgi:hypothetical protein
MYGGVDVMPAISEMYPIPAEIKKLHIFLGDWLLHRVVAVILEIFLRVFSRWDTESTP